MKIYFKNMVSASCKMFVRSELEKLGLPYTRVDLGEAEITEDISSLKWNQLNTALKTSGIELMHDKKSIIVEKIKTVIVELIHYPHQPLKINFSDYLSHKLQYDYTYLSNLFTKFQGVSIEHFLIMHKIERVKELITYDELNIKEIAGEMGYRSTSHLCIQFKKITGFTVSFFKKIKANKRLALENI